MKDNAIRQLYIYTIGAENFSMQQKSDVILEKQVMMQTTKMIDRLFKIHHLKLNLYCLA